MSNKEYLKKINNLGINLERLNIFIGKKTNIPFSTGCYQKDNIWYLYGVDERQNFVITKSGTEDEIFDYLYMITLGIKKQYSN